MPWEADVALFILKNCLRSSSFAKQCAYGQHRHTHRPVSGFGFIQLSVGYAPLDGAVGEQQNSLAFLSAQNVIGWTAENIGQLLC